MREGTQGISGGGGRGKLEVNRSVSVRTFVVTLVVVAVEALGAAAVLRAGRRAAAL